MQWNYGGRVEEKKCKPKGKEDITQEERWLKHAKDAKQNVGLNAKCNKPKGEESKSSLDLAGGAIGIKDAFIYCLTYLLYGRTYVIEG